MSLLGRIGSTMGHLRPRFGYPGPCLPHHGLRGPMFAPIWAPNCPTWPPSGLNMAFRRVIFVRPHRGFYSPNLSSAMLPPRPSNMYNIAPRGSQAAPKCPNMAQCCLKIASRCPLDGPHMAAQACKKEKNCSPEVPRSPKRLPSCPKMLQHGPTLPQDSLKMTPRWPLDGRRGFQKTRKFRYGLSFSSFSSFYFSSLPMLLPVLLPMLLPLFLLLLLLLPLDVLHCKQAYYEILLLLILLSVPSPHVLLFFPPQGFSPRHCRESKITTQQHRHGHLD